MTRAITTGYSRQPMGNRVIEILQECWAILSRLFAIICILSKFLVSSLNAHLNSLDPVQLRSAC